MASITSNSSVIFVNGVGFYEDQAQNLATQMSNASNVQVDLHYNPCSLPAANLPDLHTSGTIRSLRDRIRDLVNNNKEVLIIAHSYGAYITHKALEDSDHYENFISFADDFFAFKWSRLSLNYNDGIDRSKVQRLVTIHSFGGVCLIPNSLVKKVVNYRVATDYIVYYGCVNMFQRTWSSIQGSGNKDGYTTEIFDPNPQASARESHAFENFYIHKAILKIKSSFGAPEEEREPLMDTLKKLLICINKGEVFDPFNKLEENIATELCYNVWKIYLENSWIKITLSCNWGRNAFRYSNYTKQDYKIWAIWRFMGEHQMPIP